jgi:pilus assembly protein CpaC
MTRKFTSALAGLILVILVAGPEARQQAPAFGNATAVTGRDAAVNTPTTVNLLVGRSTIVDIGGTIARVSLTVPDVADAMVTAPTQLLVHGKSPGTISMFVWDRMGAIKTYEVIVRRDLSSLVEQVKSLFPGEAITVAGSGKDVVLSGTVSTKYVIEKAAEVAGGYVEKKENVVNLLKQQEGVASNQIMLKVRFAEVSRNALQELGVSFFADNKNSRWFGRTTTQQFAAPYFDKNQPSAALDDTMVFSDYLNLFLFDAKNSIGAAVRALQSKGVFQSLAEPNLIASNGKEASFLAGGEFPYPVPQGNFGSFTIHFKEYGVRLTFTPTMVGGDLIHLKLKPEVSSLDFNNAIVIEGFRIPALTSRRTETEVELRDGQTFAIAGLMNNSVLQSMRKVPGLGDIPILGYLFQSKAYQKEQTELVVMVTPHIVRRNSTGVSEGLPSLVEPYLGPNTKPVPNPAPYNGSPYSGAPKGPGGDAPTPAPTAAAAPAPAPAPAKSLASVPGAERVSDPVPSTPIQATPTLPVASPSNPPAVSASNPPADNGASVPVITPTTAPAPPSPVAAPAEPPMTKAEKKFIEQEKARQRKQAEAEEKQRLADEKRKAEEDKAAAKKAEEERIKAEKLGKELARKQAEADKKASEEARKKQEEEQKREKSLSEAADRLKAAQSAYQAELAKNNKGGQ